MLQFRNLSNATAALLLAAAVLLIFATSASAQQTTLEKLREQGFIRAGFANESPYGFVNSDGKLTGISPAVARVVLKRIGIAEIHGIQSTFSSLVFGLNAGLWNIATAGMFITPKRCKKVDFSIPTYKMGESFLVAKGNPQDLHSFKDVAENPEAKLAVIAGGVEADLAKAAGVPANRIVEMPTQASMLTAVIQGVVDAAALTELSIVHMAQVGGASVQAVRDFRSPPSTIGYGGLAFDPDDDVLREAVNNALRKFIGSPAHLKLVSQFGLTEANIPEPGVTTAELCRGEQGKELKDMEPVESEGDAPAK